MQRDWRLIRTILLAAEKNGYNDRLTLKDFPDENPYEVSYNVELLLSAQLVTCTRSNEKCYPEPTDFWLYSPTWQGHELLSSIQDEGTWAKVSDIIKTKGETLTFEILKNIGTSLTQTMLQTLIM